MRLFADSTLSAREILPNMRSQMRREVFHFRNLFHVLQCKIRENRQHAGIGRLGISNESHPDAILARPFRMTRNCSDDALRDAGPCKNLQDLRLGEKRVAEREIESLWVPFREERASDSRGPATRERQLLSHGEMRHPRDDNFFRDAADIGGPGRQQTEPNEIQKVKLAHKGYGEPLWGSRMTRNAQANPFTGSPLSFFSDRAQHGGWEVQALQQQRYMRILEAWVLKQCKQGFFAGFMDQRPQLVSRSRARMLDPRS